MNNSSILVYLSPASQYQVHYLCNDFGKITLHMLFGMNDFINSLTLSMYFYHQAPAHRSSLFATSPMRVSVCVDMPLIPVSALLSSPANAVLPLTVV